MKMLKAIAVFCLLNGLLITGAFAEQAGAVSAPTQKKAKNVEYLFLEVADKGTLQKNKDNETYTLTLEGVDGWVTYFSNVPHRVTGLMTVESFSKLMNQETTKNHPQGLNAGLIAVDSKTKQKLRYMISLSNPVYNAKQETVSFIAHPIPGEHKNPLPESDHGFEHVSVFIDSFCLECLPDL